ncbi:cytochrome P450 [Dichomitus squalens]|uniref:Cytochrome P450 n=1 Tax=Dichomitus squalens TaxID=114155 RepID=A0A4Q9Q539_9APHY|nr:cytochrome P450 [Dichomitus squalens]
MLSMNHLSIILLLGGLVVLVHISGIGRARRLPVPPGPPGLPIIGNVFDLPRSKPWLTYQDWAMKYGKLIYMNVLGQSILVINDANAAVELLEKRCSIYSSRPQFRMAQLTGWHWHMALLPYGKRWRDLRRVFWQYFRPDVLSKYREDQEAGAHILLRKLLASPEKLTEHLHYSVGAAILRIVYGLDVAEDKDRNIALAHKALSGVEFHIAGSFVLEYFPILARVPRWLPGTALLCRLDSIRQAVLQFRDEPWSYVQEMKATDTLRRCIAWDMMEQMPGSSGEFGASLSDSTARSAAGVAYAAGIDTLYATLQRLFVAMTLHPEVQKKAQAELDAAVGPSRLPIFGDRSALPYVNAIVKECFRWNATLPLGVAHATLADDTYEGYHIPKQTTVFVNAWAILNNPEEYPVPDNFVPDRFLRDGKPNLSIRDPATVAFGFGRRICPGRYFADETMFIFVASVLHTFNISPALDDKGQSIQVRPLLTTSLTAYLEDCRCMIRPRSIQAETLIVRTADRQVE